MTQPHNLSSSRRALKRVGQRGRMPSRVILGPYRLEVHTILPHMHILSHISAFTKQSLTCATSFIKSSNAIKGRVQSELNLETRFSSHYFLATIVPIVGNKKMESSVHVPPSAQHNNFSVCTHMMIALFGERITFLVGSTPNSIAP